MNLRRLKHTLLRLSLEEKVIGIGTIVIMIGCFLPWFTTINIIDKKSLVEYGFSGDLGVIGFVIFLMSLLGLIAMVAENLHIPFPKFGNKRENIVFFFVGQTAFLTLLTMAIYTKRSMDSIDADLRFGIYLVLTAGFLSALGAFSLVRKKRQKEVMEFFEHPEGHEESTEISGTEAQKEEEMLQEALAFDQDEAVLDEIDEAFNDSKLNEKETAPEEKTNLKEEMNEKVEEKSESSSENLEEKTPVNQANYFTREAGIKEKEEEKKESKAPIVGFYDDK